MPPPIKSKKGFVLQNPVHLHPTLWSIQTSQEPEDYAAGRYEVVDKLRDIAGWHDGESDGYIHCLRGPDHRLGWVHQAAIPFFQTAEDKRSEDFEWNNPSYDFIPEHEVVSRIKLTKEFPAWHYLNDIGKKEPQLQTAGVYAIVDVGEVNTDAELPDDLPGKFVIYNIERGGNDRIWVAEAHLNEALE